MKLHVEEKLRKYLTDLKARRDELERKILFCDQHKMFEESRWLHRELHILTSEYVEINNKVLGIYF